MKPSSALATLLAALALPALAAGATPVSRDALLPEEENAVKVADAALPSVVQVEAVKAERPPEPEVSPEFQKFFGQLNGQDRPRRSVGTGVVWDDAGHVVTMAPISENGSTYTLVFADGTRRGARLVGSDSLSGIVVLKIDGPTAGLHPVAAGTSRSLRVGQRLYVVGNAYGRVNILSEGMLGGITTALSDDGHASLVLNASINPGNAGGPVLDTAGQLVGLVEGRYAAASSPGYALGVPVDDLATAATALIAHGKIDHPKLGVSIATPAEPDLPAGLPPGVVVVQVDPKGAAERAGILPRAGDAIDVITAFEGTPVRTLGDVRAQLDKHHPGDACQLDVWRSGKTRRVTVTLDNARR